MLATAFRPYGSGRGTLEGVEGPLTARVGCSVTALTTSDISPKGGRAVRLGVGSGQRCPVDV
eukprot:4611301-Prymnesium_polylepis.3